MWELTRGHYPSTYSALKLKDEKVVPNAVYGCMPEEGRRKGGDAYLCYSCENTRLHDMARHSAASHIQEAGGGGGAACGRLAKGARPRVVAAVEG